MALSKVGNLDLDDDIAFIVIYQNGQIKAK